MKPVDAELTDAEFYAGLVLIDPLLFRMAFFEDELGQEPSKEQKLFMCDESTKVNICTGRKIAKSVHLEALVCQFGLTHFSKGITEALFVTPSETHMRPILDRIFGRIEEIPLFKACVKKKGRGDTAIIDWASNVRVYFAIEGISGKDTNMVGYRAERIWMDEGAFGSFVCHNSRLQTALPNARFVYAGVPNGIRATPFYAIDQTELGRGWSRHKYPTFINPLYQNDKAKQTLIDNYGGVNTQGYITQVLGEWGDEMTSSFPAGSIATKGHPYFYKSIIGLKDTSFSPALVLGVPSVRCKQFAIGWDYGFSPDPSELIVAIRADDDDEWREYLRVEMRRVPQPSQVIIANHIIRGGVASGELVGVSCDNLAVIQQLQSLNVDLAQLILWSSPGGVTAVKMQEIDDKGALAIVEKNVPNKQHYTETLKAWMINATIGLEGRKFYISENDKDAIEELRDTTERKGGNNYIIYYGRRDPNNSRAMLDNIREGLTYTVHAIMNLGTTVDMQSETAWLGEAGFF